MPAIRCHEFIEMAPDVALGLLSGDDRAQALEHLAHCPACRDHLEGLIRVADGLLLLAPLGEPSIGFETRVMDRLASEGAFSRTGAAPPAAIDSPHPSTDPPQPAGTGADPQAARPAGSRLGEPTALRAGHRWTSRGAILVAALAAVVVVVAGVAGLLARRTTATHRSPVAAQAVEVPADDNSGTCRLVVFAGRSGRPAELVIHLDEAGEQASSYAVLADPANGGPEIPLGTIAVHNGQGTLDVTVPAGTGPVNRVQIIDSGRVHYQAAFASV